MSHNPVPIPAIDRHVTPDQAGLVRRVGTEIVVRSGFYDLDIDVQRQVMNSARELAFLDGWVALDDESNLDDFMVIGEDGSERYPLMRSV